MPRMAKDMDIFLGFGTSVPIPISSEGEENYFVACPAVGRMMRADVRVAACLGCHFLLWG